MSSITFTTRPAMYLAIGIVSGIIILQFSPITKLIDWLSPKPKLQKKQRKTTARIRTLATRSRNGSQIPPVDENSSAVSRPVSRRIRRRNRNGPLAQQEESTDAFDNFFDSDAQDDQTLPWSVPVDISLSDEDVEEACSVNHANSIDGSVASPDANLFGNQDSEESSGVPLIPFTSSEDRFIEESSTLLNLLYSVAEEHARKEGYVHRSITCNHCSTSPIRGFRYKCANCPDFDLCENCEALEVHCKTHVFIKIRVPIPPLANPRTTTIPMMYPGSEFTAQPPSYNLAELQGITHFDQVELDAFQVQFKSLSTSIDEFISGITKETFERCLGPVGIEQNLITDRMFDFFDQDLDGVLSFKDFVCGLSILCKGSLDERIKYAFKGYDLNGDGYISRSELQKMFRAYFQLSMELVRDVVKTMEEGLIDSFDDEAAKPVSSAFQAPIPNNPSDDEEDEENGSKPTRQKQKRLAKKQAENDYSGTILSEGLKQPKRALPVIPAIHASSVGHGSRHFKRVMQYTPTTQVAPTSPQESTSQATGEANGLFPLRIQSFSSYPPLRQLEESLNSPTYSHGTPFDETDSFPMIETLSQDAIDELIDKIFSMVGTEERLDFEQFKKVAEQDTNILAWFEALGSVF